MWEGVLSASNFDTSHEYSYRGETIQLWAMWKHSEETVQLWAMWKDVLSKSVLSKMELGMSHENSHRREAIQHLDFPHESSYKGDTILLQGVWKDIL
jgi:hypothetical protein